MTHSPVLFKVTNAINKWIILWIYLAFAFLTPLINSIKQLPILVLPTVNTDLCICDLLMILMSRGVERKKIKKYTDLYLLS